MQKRQQVVLWLNIKLNSEQSFTKTNLLISKINERVNEINRINKKNRANKLFFASQT